MSRYFDPTNDFSFKKIFSNEARLKDFLNVMLDLPDALKIVSITYLPTNTIPEVYDAKRSFFDLKVKDQSNNWYIIEMQKRSERDYIKRVQYYSCHSYVEQLKTGIRHSDLLPVIVVSIMLGKLFPNDVPCISHHKILETTTNTQHLYDLSYVFIELGKYDLSIKSPKDEWMHLFKCAEKEDSPPSMIKNDQVISCYDVLETYKWTTEERDAFIRAKLFEDTQDINLSEEYNKGHAEGHTEGEHKRATEIANKMLKRGDGICEIIDVTGLSKEEVEDIVLIEKSKG